MKKNEMMIARAEALGSNGEGIVKANGMTLFVPYLLPGERAEITVLKVKGNIGYGKVGEIFTPAEERVRAVCPVFGRCGGCQLQHLSYRYQLKYKTKLVTEALKKIAGLNFEGNFCERSEKEYGYRNKLQLPIGQQNGKNVIGFYAERSHRIVPTAVCPIHPGWSEPLIAAMYRYMEKCGLSGYEEKTATGQLRHIVVREVKRKFLITLVTAEREIAGIDYLVRLLDDIFHEYSLYLNYHPENTNVVFGKEFRLVKGPGVYGGMEGGIEYEAGAETFLQVNEGVRNKLYDRAVSLIGANETVADCYAGGGLLTAMFAKRCEKAYGIEIVPEANACAERLKARNKLFDKMENICGTVEENLPKILKAHGQTTVVLDPPRAGVDRSVLDAIKSAGVKKVIYISCNPATLARDLGILCGSLKINEQGALVKSYEEGEYHIELLQPFDMFPQTKHVETLVMLSHKKPDVGIGGEFKEKEASLLEKNA